MMTGRYKGQPMQKHFALGQLRPEHFELWLALFETCAKEVCEPDVAAVFTARAHNIARSLKLGLFGVPEIIARSNGGGGSRENATG